MLILRRKAGETLQIGEDIQVTVLSVDPGGNVNLGISAPKDLSILRSELKQAACANQDAASQTTPQLLKVLGSAVASSALPPKTNRKEE